jgi:hypothetical protein
MKLVRVGVVLLVSLGILLLIVAGTDRAQLNRSAFDSTNTVRDVDLPNSVVIPTRIGLAAILCSALASVVMFGRRLPRRYMLLWLAFLALSVCLAIRGLEWQDLRSPAIYSSMAPVFVLASGVLFIGADRRSWTLFRRVAITIVFAVSILAMLQVIQLVSTNRGEAYGRISVFAGILEVGCLLPLGTSVERKPLIRLLAWLPLGALLMCTIAMQARLMVIEVFSLFIAITLLRARASGSLNAVVRNGLVASFVIGACVVFIYSGLNLMVAESVDAFWDRRDADTRTTQAQNFFQRIEPQDLITGIGIPRPGEYNGQGERGIDLGFINILFIGGLPALCLFVPLHIYPAIKCSKLKLSPQDAPVVAAILTYGIRLFSSTVPNLEPHYIILLIFMGRSAAIASGSRHGLRMWTARSSVFSGLRNPVGQIVSPVPSL